MSLQDLSKRESVQQAIDEFDALGQDAFLKKYGFGKSYKYLLSHNGHRYDSKAVLGAAHFYEFGQPLLHTEFSGGIAQTVKKLTELGFSVVPNGIDYSVLTPDDVHAVLADFDRLGRDGFLQQYGGSGAQKFFIHLDDKEYDAKPVLVMAFRRHEMFAHVGSSDIDSTREGVADPLINLGFEVSIKGGSVNMEQGSLSATIQRVMELQDNSTPVVPSDDSQERLRLLDQIMGSLVDSLQPTYQNKEGQSFSLSHDFNREATKNTSVSNEIKVRSISSSEWIAGYLELIFFAKSCYLYTTDYGSPITEAVTENDQGNRAARGQQAPGNQLKKITLIPPPGNENDGRHAVYAQLELIGGDTSTPGKSTGRIIITGDGADTGRPKKLPDGSQVKNTPPNQRVGPGRYRSKLEEIIEDLQLSHKVEQKPEVETPRKGAKRRSFDGFVIKGASLDESTRILVQIDQLLGAQKYVRDEVPPDAEIVSDAEHLLEMFADLYKKDFGMFINENPMIHVLLKWSSKQFPNNSRIAEHRRMLAEKGTVVWAKSGKAIGNSRVEALQRQLDSSQVTHIYLKGGVPEEVFCATLSHITQGTSGVDVDKIPSYYRDRLTGEETCFTLSAIDTVDLFPNIDDILYMESSPEKKLSESFGGQQSTIYVREKSPIGVSSSMRETGKSVEFDRLRELANTLNWDVDYTRDVVDGPDGASRHRENLCCSSDCKLSS